MNTTHGTLHSQFLCHGRKVADRVRAEGLVVNRSRIHRVLPEKVVVESQVGQRDHRAAFQGETSVQVSSLGKLCMQAGQVVKMCAELADQSSRPLKPER